MAPNPHLHNLLQEIIQWCSESDFPYGVHILWTDTQLKTLVNYLCQVEVDSSFSSWMYRKLRFNEAWQDKDIFKPQICTRATLLVVSFMQDLGELFKVPKLQQLSHHHIDKPLNDNQLVADHDQVQSMMAEFEQLANRAGSLVHSLIFLPDVAVKTMNEAICALLEHVEQLKANIVKFLDLSPNIVDLIPTTNYDVESLYIVGSLQHDLNDLIYGDDNPLAEVKDQIVTLQKCLMICQSLLKVPPCTETEDLNKEPKVQVIGVAYDAEYLINSFLVGDVHLWYLTIRLTHHLRKIKLIEGRLQQTKKDCDIEVAKVPSQLLTKLSLHTNNDFGVDDIIVGFEENEIVILDQLVRGTLHLQSILIFGMSGLGKTTMARKLYNHQYVKYRFDKKSWCVVSQVYEKKNLLIDILVNLQKELDKSMMLGMDEDSLALKIYQNLKGQRYLIVVDDVWNSYLWEDHQRIFPDDYNGSRILFTSRNKHVAPPGSIVHKLPFLSKDQCWELLQKKVFHNKPCPSYLQRIGMKIATKCHGLPLIVVVVAGIVSTLDMEESARETVDRNLDSYMHLDQNKSVMQILELSYKHLPPHLKPCFLFFGIAAQARKFYSKGLKQLWIAEGLITLEEERAECMAEKYLTELIDRSLVIVFETGLSGGAKLCGIHDLLYGLCLRLAEKHNFLKSLDRDCSIWHQKDHRLLILPPDQSSSYCLVVSPCIRSFFLQSLDSSFSVLNMKSLRTLICGNKFSNLDILGVDHLVHLRTLAVNDMVPLIDCLVNLEFLLVRGYVGITSMQGKRFLNCISLGLRRGDGTPRMVSSSTCGSSY